MTDISFHDFFLGSLFFSLVSLEQWIHEDDWWDAGCALWKFSQKCVFAVIYRIDCSSKCFWAAFIFFEWIQKVSIFGFWWSSSKEGPFIVSEMGKIVSFWKGAFPLVLSTLSNNRGHYLELKSDKFSRQFVKVGLLNSDLLFLFWQIREHLQIHFLFPAEWIS